jgi:hypothetical protein
MEETTAVQSPESASVPNYNVSPRLGARKPAIPSTLTVVRAAQIKPCDAEKVPGKDPEAEPLDRSLLVFVTPGGQQQTRPCVAAVTRSIMPASPDNPEGKGLDMIDNSDFLIYVDSKSGMAVRVEAVERYEFARGLIPTELEAVKLAEFHIETEHGFASIAKYPPKLDREIVIQMKTELDRLTEVAPGVKLAGRYAITDVQSGVGGIVVRVNPLLTR